MLIRLRRLLPFPLRGIDSDNDSAFLNTHLWRYCRQEELAFTCSRPYRKNDQAHVEQKNWVAVRRLIGYESPQALALLRAIYADWRLVSKEQLQRLYLGLNPVALQRRMEGHLRRLWELDR